MRSQFSAIGMNSDGGIVAALGMVPAHERLEARDLLVRQMRTIGW